MEKLSICFDFSLSLKVRTYKGKTYNAYWVKVLGSTYRGAVWAAFFDLKKKRKIILQVNQAKVTGIAFAYSPTCDRITGLKLSDHYPQIPQDLNTEIPLLPQKKI